MCPLRIILIFLSATLAGFFVLRNLKSEPELAFQSPSDHETHENLDKSGKTQFPNSTTSQPSRFSKVCSAVESGFWTCVDMASGRYLWRHLVSANSKRSE